MKPEVQREVRVRVRKGSCKGSKGQEEEARKGKEEEARKDY